MGGSPCRKPTYLLPKYSNYFLSAPSYYISNISLLSLSLSLSYTVINAYLHNETWLCHLDIFKLNSTKSTKRKKHSFALNESCDSGQHILLFLTLISPSLFPPAYVSSSCCGQHAEGCRKGLCEVDSISHILHLTTQPKKKRIVIAWKHPIIAN